MHVLPQGFPVVHILQQYPPPLLELLLPPLLLELLLPPSFGVASVMIKFCWSCCQVRVTSRPAMLVLQVALCPVRNSVPKVVTVNVACANCWSSSKTQMVWVPSSSRSQLICAMKPLLISPQAASVSPRSPP